mmetsp:Transcript_20095/g.35577  ORF Transcript_20095/g.35577 Transcript_20095/m.35577 type:complete len:143 (-) Transcript_20095:174-602(-)
MNTIAFALLSLAALGNAAQVPDAEGESSQLKSLATLLQAFNSPTGAGAPTRTSPSVTTRDRATVMKEPVVAKESAGLLKPGPLASAMALATTLFPLAAGAVTPDEIWTYAGYTELLIFYGIANGFLLIYLFDEIDRQAGRFD